MPARPEPITLVPGDARAQARQLQAAGPLARVVVEGLEVWALTQDGALRSALTDRRFVRSWRAWTDLVEGTVPPDHPVAAMVYLDNMLTADGPDHRRLRGLISQGFTPRRIEGLQPAIEAVVEDLLEQIADMPGPVDLKGEFADPLSMAVFADLFGITPHENDRLRQMVSTAFATAAPARVRAMRAEVEAYLDALIAAKRTAPGADVTSALIHARDGGDRLSDQELRDTLWLLLTAGFATTAAALVNGIEVLLAHPEQRAALDAGTLSWPVAIEEIVRHSTSVATLPFLFAREDIEIGGHTIAAGQPVLLCYLAANHDPQRYAEPDTVDATRSRPRHLGFGHGPHVCLGAALARMELDIALRRLFARFPRLRLAPAGPAPRVASVFLNAAQRLLVEPDPPAPGPSHGPSPQPTGGDAPSSHQNRDS